MFSCLHTDCHKLETRCLEDQPMLTQWKHKRILLPSSCRQQEGKSPGIRSNSSQRTSTYVHAAPQIDMEVLTPKGDKKFKTESGDNARLALLDEKADLYGLWGKAMNCGGAGNCGTCLVEILEGAELLSEWTSSEQKKLKGKPDSWRLACQLNIGDGHSPGTLKMRTQPK